MVMAPLADGREADLRALLESMNQAPGMADPDNAVLPFGAFEQLHFARLVLLDDPTLADVEAYGLQPSKPPLCLAFMGDCDGSARQLLAAMVQRAEVGLRRIFGHCEGLDAHGDLLAWLLAHDIPVAANYVNRVGRSVLQIRQESSLQRVLSAKVVRRPLASGAEVQATRNSLIAFVEAEQHAGRLALTPPQRTPPGWRIASLVNLVAVPLVGLLALPLLIVLLPWLAWLLRTRETSDPEICPRPQAAALHALQELEDHEVSNQYTAIGTLKPGRFRRWLLVALLVLVDYGCRHVFTRGHLARVQTIHFARWVFIDDKRRVVFVSNYDGGHQAYMDDFINKVGWGLNLLFSNGLGWPRTRWLILGGARLEQSFKRYQRRHQIPTQVWYKAYPGLALVDLERNQRIREGLECGAMSDAQALAWLRRL
jgi:hypothetical protein